MWTLEVYGAHKTVLGTYLRRFWEQFESLWDSAMRNISRHCGNLWRLAIGRSVCDVYGIVREGSSKVARRTRLPKNIGRCCIQPF